MEVEEEEGKIHYVQTPADLKPAPRELPTSHPTRGVTRWVALGGSGA